MADRHQAPEDIVCVDLCMWLYALCVRECGGRMLSHTIFWDINHRAKSAEVQGFCSSSSKSARNRLEFFCMYAIISFRCFELIFFSDKG